MTRSIIIFYFILLANAGMAQLVLPGDYPDPSVVKIGDVYWASATTSNWAPVFPLLKSTDLIQWENKGFVFNELPSWADFYFWAPEITYDNGKVFVYYSAHRQGANLCLSVASAEQPEGPYTDHGPLLCQPAGSIDAFPMRDEQGTLYLIWKEDGNSIGEPTPIWAMEMKEDRSGLIGTKKELFRNDKAWEGNLVEGVSMLRHGNYYYAFYAAAACCGRGCNYATGVARATNLLGPWEKYENNPVLTDAGNWKCLGHGTPVEKDGRYFLLLHGYHKKDGVYPGRQGLLKEFRFTQDGWIEFVDQQIIEVAVPKTMEEDFSADALSPEWQWSVFQQVNHTLHDGKLVLHALPQKPGALLGHKTYRADYTVTVTMRVNESTAEGGVAAIGDEKNCMGVSVTGEKLTVWKLKEDKETRLPEVTINHTGVVHLRMQVKDGGNIMFYYSTNGKKYKRLHDKALDGSYLPPWDRAVRAGVFSKGKADQKAVFDHFVLRH